MVAEFAYRDINWAGVPAIQAQGVRNGQPYAWLQRTYGNRDEAVKKAQAALKADGAEPCEVSEADWVNPNRHKRALWTHQSKRVQLQANPKDSVARFRLVKSDPEQLPTGSADLALDESECRSLAAALLEFADHMKKTRDNG